MISAFAQPDWWLVIVGAITAVVVAWQAYESRRAAEAASRQIAIARKTIALQFRPIVHVRTVRLEETDDSLSVQLIIVNKGGTNAHILEGIVTLDWIWNHSPKSHVASASFAPSVLQPGEQESLKINLSDNWLVYRFSVDPNYASGMQLRCRGTIGYTDDNGVKRQSGFSRLRNAVTEKWETDPDPEFEYAD